jgi:hypothetical protein
LGAGGVPAYETTPVTLPSFPAALKALPVGAVLLSPPAGSFVPQAEASASSESTIVRTSQTFVCFMNIINSSKL